MNHSDSQPPPAETELVTTEGIKVIVNNDPLPAWLTGEVEEEPEPVPAPAPAPVPSVVVRPPQAPGRDREAFFRKLDADYADFILTLILARKDVPPKSAEDVRQGALEVLFKEVDANGMPRDVECYIGGIIRNLVRNRKRRWSPDIDPCDSGSGVACRTPDPEAEAEEDERWARLFRHMNSLSQVEKEAVQCVDILGMTYDEAGDELGCHLTTVALRRNRGKEKLEDLIRASDEAARRGLRRRPPK